MIEGGGWVGVGDERTRVQAGEAVVWPPDVLHGAWTDGAPMRAIVVELAGTDARAAGGRDRGRGRAARIGATGPRRRAGEGRGRARAAPGPRAPPTPTTEEGEPL